MAEQGASQRRGNESVTTLTGQPNTLTPTGTSGVSYYSSAAGPVLATDTMGVVARVREAGRTPIGVAIPESSTQGTGYSNAPLGVRDGHDLMSVPSRVKTARSPIGVSIPETNAHGTSYASSLFGSISPIGGTGGTPTPTAVTYYKLRAKDTGAGYVEWVTTVTPLTVASYTGTPVGTLVDLTVLSIITR